MRDSKEYQNTLNTVIGYTFNGQKLPEHMHIGLTDYLVNHIPTGGFLQAVLSNNLMSACARADDWNQRALPVYAAFLYSYAPRESYGSPEAYAHWINKGE
jgi:hypothetical protein